MKIARAWELCIARTLAFFAARSGDAAAGTWAMACARELVAMGRAGFFLLVRTARKSIWLCANLLLLLETFGQRDIAMRKFV